MSGISISVLIATHHRPELLSSTLTSLFQQDFPADECELVVCVDGECRDTIQMLHTLQSPCRLVILEQPHSGKAAACNAALSQAHGKLVLLLDDDLLCPSDLLRIHCQAHSDRCPKVVLGALRSPPGKRGLGAAWDRRLSSEFLSSIRKGCVPGFPWVCANSSMPRAMLLEHGGFDASFRHALEELELGLRFWLARVPIEYLPQAVVVHVQDKTGSAVARDTRWSGWHEVELCHKHLWYRPYSRLAALGNVSLPARRLRRIATQARGIESLARLLLLASERLPLLPGGEAVGMLLLRKLLGTFHLRGAAESCGSVDALWQEFGMQVAVLLYHNVTDGRQLVPPSISPEQFERHIRWLARSGFQTITPAAWLAWVHEGTPLPPRPVLITFDDAYADVGRHALPVLREYGFTGTVFAVTHRIGGTNRWDGEKGMPERRLMSADEIVHWAGEGIDFGAHSRTHPDLRALADAELEEEVSGSRRDLQDLLGQAPCAFAYPYGFADGRVRACVGRHFGVAFGVDEGLNGLATDLLALRRTQVHARASWLAWQAHLRLGRPPFSAAYRLWNRRAPWASEPNPVVPLAPRNVHT